MLANLTEDQSRVFVDKHYFYVRGGYTGTLYRIAPFERVVVYDHSGRAIRKLCFEPQGCLPIADQMLAQKIALESDERHALRVANKSPTMRFESYGLPYARNAARRRKRNYEIGLTLATAACAAAYMAWRMM